MPKPPADNPLTIPAQSEPCDGTRGKRWSKEVIEGTKDRIIRSPTNSNNQPNNTSILQSQKIYDPSDTKIFDPSCTKIFRSSGHNGPLKSSFRHYETLKRKPQTAHLKNDSKRLLCVRSIVSLDFWACEGSEKLSLEKILRSRRGLPKWARDLPEWARDLPEWARGSVLEHRSRAPQDARENQRIPLLQRSTVIQQHGKTLT